MHRAHDLVCAVPYASGPNAPATSSAADDRGPDKMGGILFIDAEQPFADQTASALKTRGFNVTLLDDGREGLELAANSRPDLIVLCVELPKTSGYSICNKLKKDNDLKGIPLIITSKEATPETFAQHKKLKTRAEDYLIKPFSEADLVEKIGALIAMPDGGGGGGGGGDVLADLGADLDLGPSTPDEGDVRLDVEDLAGLEADIEPTAAPAPSLDDDGFAGLHGLGELGGDDDGLGDLGDLGDLGGDMELAGSVQDDNLAGLDDALDAMSPEPEAAPPLAAPPAAAAAAMPPRRPTPAPSMPPSSSSSAADLQALQVARRENSDLKTKIAELEARLRQADEAARAAASASTPPTSASAAREVLTLKQQLRAKDDEILQKESALVDAQEQLEIIQTETAQKLAEASNKDVEISSLTARVAALSDERDQLEQQVQDRLHQAEAERDQLRGEYEALRAEGDTLRQAVQDAGSRADDLATKLQSAEASLSSVQGDLKVKEQDALKAFQLLKTEEQIREKARQATELAFKLLSGEVSE